MRGSDGMFHINGQDYRELVGSRAQVMHGTAYKTSGGLVKKDLCQNKSGKYVSCLKQKQNKSKSNLKGYLAPKGSHTFQLQRKRSVRRRRSV